MSLSSILNPSITGHRGKCYLMCCAGGVSKTKRNEELDNTEVFMMAFFRDCFARIINHWAGKVTILVLTFAYLGIGIWGCIGLNQGLERKNLAADDSYVGDFYNAEDIYFHKYDFQVQVVVHSEIDSKEKADHVNELITELEQTEYFVGGKSTSSWLRDYQAYCNKTGYQIDYSNLFDSYFNSFLQQPAYQGYKNDVLVDTNIFRFIVTSNFSEGTEGERLMMLKSREVAANYPDLGVTVYSPLFIFTEQYVAVFPNTIQNMIIAVISMLCVSLLLIPHPVVSIWVTLSIASICCGVVGYMALWEVSLDAVSMINIIMCIGFCVDFSAHITYAFVTSQSQTRKERVKDALYALGLPLLQASISTILALTPLAASFAYTFRTFFKIMFLVILFGMLHGLFVIPVLLSMLGPTGTECGDSGQTNLNPTGEVVPVECPDLKKVRTIENGSPTKGIDTEISDTENANVENGKVKKGCICFCSWHAQAYFF